jgi:hypothetical protein
MAGVLPSPAPLRRFTVRHPHHLRHLLIIGDGKIWKIRVPLWLNSAAVAVIKKAD